jgi:hypothetical protein
VFAYPVVTGWWRSSTSASGRVGARRPTRPATVNSLPAPVKRDVFAAIARAVEHVFVWAVPGAVVVFVLAWFLARTLTSGDSTRHNSCRHANRRHGPWQSGTQARHQAPAPREPLQRREQIKKYSTASLGPTRGMFAFTCMLAAFSSVRVGWPPCQLYDVGKYLSIVKRRARLRWKSSNG